MSGILGCAGYPLRPIQADRMRRAIRVLQNRGLDDQAFLLCDCGGYSRLFLNPVSNEWRLSHGSPSSSGWSLAMLVSGNNREADRASLTEPKGRWPDDRVLLACDGVVDNSRELIQDLTAIGHELLSHSQVDVLRAAFDQWGPDCLSRITGSFACAVVDFRRRCLILARDAFGTRPLYFAREDSSLFFAAQIGAVLEAGSVARKANHASMYRYLAHNMMEHGVETFFAGVEQVLPGHYLEVPLEKPAQSSLIRYRRVTSARTKLTFDEAVNRLRQLVIGAVASQAGVHKRVGAALSGGLDSSFVVAAFARAKPGAQLAPYTCVPIVKSGTFSQSEETWADLAGEGLGIPVNKVRVPADQLPANFESLIRLHEEPFSSPVVFAQLQLFRAAREDGIEIMLSGQGGDTMFTTSTDQLLRAVWAHVRRGHWRTAMATAQAGGRLPENGFRRLALSAARLAIPKRRQAFLRRLRRTPRLHWLKEEWFDLPVGRPDEFALPMLRLEDRNSTACSILNRMPLLIPELQDFVCSLPTEYLVRPNQPIKSIESAAMRGLVPDAILARRERLGFPVPIREWLLELEPWVDGNIKELESFPVFEPDAVRQIWDRVRSREQSTLEAFLVWRWVFLAGWVRYYNISWD